MSKVQYDLHDRIAVVTFTNPPVNGINHEIRAGLSRAVEQALSDPGVDGVVITGGGGNFSAGADIREFGTPQAAGSPDIAGVIARIEASAKPVVAAITGVCMGGGLELAMGCHARVAHRDAILALPEVTLGLLPGAGGTQRLPRAIGVEQALHMITSGERRRAEEFTGTALINEVTDGPPLAAAIAFAQAAAASGHPLRRLRDVTLDAAAAEPAIRQARDTIRARQPRLQAPPACVDAVAASVTMPMDEGLALERNLFMSLLDSAQSRALRHAFAAERAAGKVEGLPDGIATLPVKSAGVIGAGTMGRGIAMVLANAGIPTVLVEANPDALAAGMAAIRQTYETATARGRMSADAAGRTLSLISPVLGYDTLGSVDLVVEAVFESMQVKADVFAKLDAVCKQGAILASNTSGLDLNRIAALTSRPQNVIGLHFFSPPVQMKLLEVVRGAATDPEVLATAMALARRLGKIAVVSGVCEGFIGNRMLGRYSAAANELVHMGAEPQQVDQALQDFGFAMGLFRVSDLAGIDIAHAGRLRRAAANPGTPLAPAFTDRLYEAGRLGQKTGSGWYRYEPGQRQPIPDPKVTAMLAEWRREHGMTPRAVSDKEIVERCIYALVNEGARILADGIAQRSGDIDVVYLNGYGFPRFRGGPMHYAAEVGLPRVVATLRRIASESPADAAFWTPAPLLEDLAARGAGWPASARIP